MTSSHSTAEYRQLYQFLSDKYQDTLDRADQLAHSETTIDQCTKLMQLRISTLVSQLEKADVLTNGTISPKTTLEEVRKLETHSEAIDLLSQIENTPDVDQALALIPPSLASFESFPRSMGLPEVEPRWTPYNESIGNLLASIKVNTNFVNEVSSYKDLKRKIDEYQPSEFVLMGLANQEAEAKKRKKLAKQDEADSSIIRDEA